MVKTAIHSVHNFTIIIRQNTHDGEKRPHNVGARALLLAAATNSRHIITTVMRQMCHKLDFTLTSIGEIIPQWVERWFLVPEWKTSCVGCDTVSSRCPVDNTSTDTCIKNVQNNTEMCYWFVTCTFIKQILENFKGCIILPLTCMDFLQIYNK